MSFHATVPHLQLSAPLLHHPEARYSYNYNTITMSDALVQELLKESKAEYRNLGKSGLKVSVPILGAMSFGSKKW